MRLRLGLGGWVRFGDGPARKTNIWIVVSNSIVLIAAVGVVLSAPQRARGQASKTPERFEVASIRRCEGDFEPGGRGGGGPSSPGRLTMNCQTVEGFIQAAFVLFADGKAQPPTAGALSGGPGWIRSERYTISATAPGASVDRMRGPMLQALLEDRFGLKIHREQREVPAYLMVLATRTYTAARCFVCIYSP